MLKDFVKKNLIWFILVVFMSYQGIQNVAYKEVIDNLLSHSVPIINVEQVLKLQAKRGFVILDTRTAREYEVSHIQNSRWVGYESFEPQKVADISTDKTVIVYCSVGYRSEKVGERLQKMGFKKIFNLHGGIFQWINQGQDVFQNGSKTDSIHVYNHHWGQWVNKGKKTIR